VTGPVLLIAALLAADQPPPASTGPPDNNGGDVAEEPQGGAGVTPIEIVPRLELRHSFQRLQNGVALHETTTEMDIQFVQRLLLRLQIPYRTLETPAGQVSGPGDIQLGILAIVDSSAKYLVALLGGIVLDSATQPVLGTGKQQPYVGGGAAIKLARWILAYGVVQEQWSVGGDSSRPKINQLTGDLGAVVFGRQYNWLKVDLFPTVSFPGGASGQLSGLLEAGSLLIGRVGLFVRVGTQLAGDRQLDYSVAGGIRYLFRLSKGKTL